MRIRRLATAALSALTLAGGLALAPTVATAATTGPAATTAVTHVLPVTAKGALAPGYTIVQTLKGGSCSAGSEVSAQGYRCFAGDVVADPCFPLAATSGFKVACLGDPFSKKVYAITGPGALEATTKSHNEPVWGIRLTNGLLCSAAQGAHSLVAGKHVVNYYCNTTSGLVDSPSHAHQPFTIRAAVIHGNTTTLGATYKIKTLVYAGFTH